MINRCLMLALALAACGPSKAEIRQARDAMYQTDRATVWKAIVAEFHGRYPRSQIMIEDESRGVMVTKWKGVEATADQEDVGTTLDPSKRGKTYTARVMFRYLVKLEEGGPPWYVTVDGEAADYRPELTVLQPYKHGADDEPAWVATRINNMRVALYHRLKQYAVAPPRSSP